MKKINKAKLLGVVFLILIFIFVGVSAGNRHQELLNAKKVQITVISRDESVTNYDIRTNAEYLRGAMEGAIGLSFSGEESAYGLMVLTVNGITADYNKDRSYWAFYVNGEYCQYGIDSQVVTDGDKFTIQYTTE